MIPPYIRSNGYYKKVRNSKCWWGCGEKKTLVQRLWEKSKNTGVGSLSLLQRIFPTQELNRALLHRRRIFHQLNHQGSPRILECVAYPVSRGSSRPSNWTGVSYIAGRFFTNWAMREALSWCSHYAKKKKTVWNFLKKLTMEPPCDIEISFLGICHKETKTLTSEDICTLMFI